MKQPPKLSIPPGVVVGVFGSRVTIDFHLISEAEAFVEFIRWLDSSESDGTSLVATKYAKPTVQ